MTFKINLECWHLPTVLYLKEFRCARKGSWQRPRHHFLCLSSLFLFSFHVEERLSWDIEAVIYFCIIKVSNFVTQLWWPGIHKQIDMILPQHLSWGSVAVIHRFDRSWEDLTASWHLWFLVGHWKKALVLDSMAFSLGAMNALLI